MGVTSQPSGQTDNRLGFRCSARIAAVAVLTGLLGSINTLAVHSRTANSDTARNRVSANGDIPLAPAEGGTRRWRIVTDVGLSVRTAPSHAAAIVETLPSDTLLSNTGCETIASEADNAVSNRVWCAITTLRGKQLGFAPALHLQPAASPDGTVPVGVDDSAARARKHDFDMSGEVPYPRAEAYQGSSL